MGQKLSEKIMGVQVIPSFVLNSQPDLRIKQYAPGGSLYAARIPDGKWEAMRPVIERLSKKGTSRRKVLEILDQRYQFHPSPAQLYTHMVAWRHNVRKAADGNVGASQSTQTSNDPTPVMAIEATDQSDDPMSLDPIVDMYGHLEFENSSRAEIIAVDHPNQATHIMNIIRQLLWLDITGLAYPSVSEELCIIHDIADFLVYSPSYSECSYFLMQHIMSLVEDKSLTTTPTTRLVLLRDCLLWSRFWETSEAALWISKRFQNVAEEVRPSEDHRLKSFFHECQSFAKGQWPSHTWWTVHSSLQPSVTDRSPDCFAHSMVENPVLLSLKNLLVAEAGSKNKPVPLSEWKVKCLLFWCQKTIRDFTLRPDRRFVNENSSVSECVNFCWAEIMNHFITDWILHTRTYCTSTSEKMWSERYPAVSDHILFKHTTRVLGLLTHLAVRKVRKFILSRIKGIDDVQKTSLFCSTVTTMLWAAMDELELEQEEIIRQYHHEIPDWANHQLTEHGPLEHLTDTLGLVAKELQLLRQDPSSQRHQEAYMCLPGRKDARRRVTGQEGSDAMLCDNNSTSSLQSFQRAGIKLKDRFGPPSMSGLSSILTRCSIGSSVGVSKMISQEMQPESTT